MEKIDLTKCNNCRFKAKIDGIATTGIVSAKDGLNAFLKNEQGYNVGCLTGAGLVDSDNRLITDFKIIPRDPETYTDWQVGDVIRAFSGNHEIIFRSGEVVVFKYSYDKASNIFTCSELFKRGYRLVLTDIEQEIIEERQTQEWTPQDGDIVAWKDKDDGGNPAISIYKEKERGYATIFSHGNTDFSTDSTFAMNIIRPATDDETRRLFDAMAKEGKRWNAEKKVVEDIPKHYEFTKGEPVLVRDGDDDIWEACVFGRYGRDDELFKYFMLSAPGYLQCIPLNERTMHLLGSTEDYKEE